MKDDAPDSGDPQPKQEQSAAALRVRGPALLLLAVSGLNLMAGVYLLLNGVFAKQVGPTAEFQKQWDAMDPADRAAFERVGWTTDDWFLALANGSLWYGGVAALVSVLTLAGARHMRMMQSYPLALTSAILTAVPCVTPCCLLGQFAGVWAFIILMQPDVRSAFQ